MHGIERTFEVSRRTLGAWLKEQANDRPPLEETLQPVECKKIPVLEVDELRSFVFRGKEKVWVWVAMNNTVGRRSADGPTLRGRGARVRSNKSGWFVIRIFAQAY